MPAGFQLVLDTTGPQAVEGALTSLDMELRTAQLGVTTTDPDTTGYQVKIWGDVDPAANPDIQALEAESQWITYTAQVGVTLSEGDGTKTVSFKLRDDVWNASVTATTQAVIETGVPVVTITSGPDVTKISEVEGKNTSVFQWSADRPYVAYEVRVVPTESSDHTTGAVIPTTAGSVNTTGGAGAASTPVTTTIKGTDLETASNGDGPKEIMVFVQAEDGDWSLPS